jgi:hypothetical protein
MKTGAGVAELIGCPAELHGVDVSLDPGELAA